MAEEQAKESSPETSPEQFGLITEQKDGGITVMKVVGTTSTIIVSVAVIIVGVLGLIAGFQSMLLGGAGFAAGAAVSSVVSQTEFVQRIGGGILLNGLLRIITAVGQIVGGIGMLLMQSWGWWVAVIASGVVLLDRVWAIFSGGLGVMDILNVFGLFIPAVLLIALLWPSIRHRYT